MVLSCSILEVKISIYWNVSMKVMSLDSIFIGNILTVEVKSTYTDEKIRVLHLPVELLLFVMELYENRGLKAKSNLQFLSQVQNLIKSSLS